MKITLPFLSVIDSYDDFSKSKLSDAMMHALGVSRTRPCYIGLDDGGSQRFLFFREHQIYSAARIDDGQLKETPIREFLQAANAMNFPSMTLYELNSKCLHSILILAQKKPGLRVMTSLVDLDEILDKIETDGKSCVVGAHRDDFMAMLRYERGAPEAMYHEESSTEPRERTFREDFLVKIYTITAETPLTISLYEDFLVKFASDAKTVDESFSGNFEELFLAKPPIVSLQFKSKEIDHWVFDRPQFKIGRTPDNDIVIDNLAVSRLHAVLEEEKGAYFVRDCDSLNGTVVNDKKVGRAKLEDGDVVSIGKHMIVFRRQGGQAVTAGETIQGFDQTVIINTPSDTVHVPHDTPPASRGPRPPRLVLKTDYGDRVIEIKKDHLTIGKDEESDVFVDGMFVGRRHAEIIRENGRVLIRKTGGIRKVTVGGKTIREVELKDNDEIKIANEAFIFQE